MELLREYRSKELAERVVKVIHKLYDEISSTRRSIKIMSFCGTHEHTIVRYGIRSLMPEGIELIAGPGCPVCITPADVIEAAAKISLEGIRVYTYGDLYRVPGINLSLAQARAQGGDVIVVYSFMDAIRLAKENRRESVFVAVGFETTQPSVASRLVKGEVPPNLKLLIAYRLTPPILKYILSQGEVPLDGIIAPGHVSTIVGSNAWAFAANEYGKPTVVAGFEPLDILIAVLEILKQIRLGKPCLHNEYTRAVSPEGNRIALRYIYEAFEITEGLWRGIGFVPDSALRLKEPYTMYDAEREYGLEIGRKDYLRPGCRCGDVIVGKAKPTDCPLFMKLCTPTRPYGPCMVSSEGTCAIWAKYGGVAYLREFTL
ncbi:MAG: hydrogenase formation protein HypD [Thermoprotei archaeon]|nr:MAG: hydrogenase formation protein HypD [Thermoprotei archaeon]